MRRTYLLILILITSIGNVSAQSVPFIDTRDGQVYQTILIDNLWWMAENLNIGTMIQSTTTGYQMSNDGIIEKYCWNNSDDYCAGTNGMTKKGGFYEWKEMVEYTTTPPEATTGICPAGWRIPTYSEWSGLFTYFGGGATAVAALLEGGSSGMNIKLTGYRCTMTGGFRPSAMSNDYMAYFWSSLDTDANNAPLFEIAATSYTSFSFQKSLGLSVRCVKSTGQILGAEFSASETFGYDELTTTFTDLSTGGPTSWSWDFGDGSTSTDQNPTHTYTSVGTFSVSLEISDGTQTVSTTKPAFITVESSSDVAGVFGNSGNHLYQSIPNPASDNCEVRFRLKTPGNVSLNIYNSALQLIQTISLEGTSAGESAFTLNVSKLPEGLYFYQLVSEDYSGMRKFNILRH
ncbi:MAG: PKD domain-containing protein [Bacteroidales bacterium]|nr:PKD domain-containing protein [Bacteroidales bacterium]MCF8455840.1 PKD domain-containing protein [Bacteroidales bacterium]